MMWYLLAAPTLGFSACLGAHLFARHRARERQARLQRRFEETLLWPHGAEANESDPSAEKTRDPDSPVSGQFVTIPRFLLLSLLLTTFVSLVAAVLALSILFIVGLRVCLW